MPFPKRFCPVGSKQYKQGKKEWLRKVYWLETKEGKDMRPSTATVAGFAEEGARTLDVSGYVEYASERFTTRGLSPECEKQVGR